MRAKYGVQPGQEFTPEEFERQWNGMIDDFQRLVPVVRPGPGSSEADFPWKTSVSKWDDGKGTPRLWRADVMLGTVNDEAPPVIYRAKDDARGWTPPQSLPEGTGIVERSLAEQDTPWLLLATPKPDSAPSITDQFKEIADSARPAFFRTEAMWEKKLFRASVFLSTTVKDLSGPNLPISALGRLKTAVRLSAGALPTVAAGSEAGVLELARLFLLREPEDAEGGADMMLVQQKVFYCVQARLNEPSPSYLISVAAPGGEVSNFDQSLASFDFWTA